MLLDPEDESGAKRGRDQLREVVRDPVEFSTRMLRHDLWERQREILHAIQHHRRVAVKACHASSKTFTAADAGLWWLTSRKPSLVLTTAPTWHQVEKLLWGEIRKSASSARIKYPNVHETQLKVAPDRYMLGLSTNEGVRFQGFHGDVLVIVDEAPGVRADILDAIEGIRAGGDVRLLELGNPVIPSGPFFDIFSRHLTGWSTHTIGAFDTPNFAGLYLEHPDLGVIGDKNGRDFLSLTDDELDANVRRYLITRRWVWERLQEWGIDHPMFYARVLGEFPVNAEGALIPLAWLEAARVRDLSEVKDGPLFGGNDVAGEGEDETVLILRRGGRIVGGTGWPGDGRGAVVRICKALGDRLRVVGVDELGLGLYYLKHLTENEVPAVGCKVTDAPVDDERYKAAKAEWYWMLREEFENRRITFKGLSKEVQDKLVSQLASIRYSIDQRGRIVIESKDDMRKRGVKSPDWAEALMLSYAASAKGARAKTKLLAPRKGYGAARVTQAETFKKL